MANHLTKFIQRNKILRAVAASLILICVLFHAAPTAAMTGDDIFDPAPAPVKDPGITATGNLSFSAGSTLDVEIGGTTPGVGGYDQIIVNGTVTIASNVTLSTTAWGGYTPSVGDSYRIISNDGADAVTGTFDGLPEGGFISNFLGSGEAAQITYAGGDGNDVVLTVITPAPEIDIQYPAGTSIADGGMHDLGIQTPGSTVTLYYVYDNSFGSDVLTVSAIGSQNYVNISGITLTSPPPTNLPARSSSSIGFQFQVGSPGPFSFDWYVNTNDADENPYNVHVAGLAGDDKHIIVQRPAGTAIADGGSDDLGNQSINTVNVTYTVDNTAGLGVLTVSDVTASNFTNATNFSLDTAMPVTVAAGGTSSFDISFDVLVNGAFSFDLDVLNDDTDTSTYDIAVSGTMDDIPPSVTINQAATQLDPTTASPIHFTAVFSEPVTGFATGDVTLSGTAGATTATVTEIAPNDGTTYNVAVSGMTADGTVTAAIGVVVAADAAGNGNTTSTFTDNTVTFDGNPEIDMQRPALISIVDGGTDALGNRGIGTVNLTYTVSNITGSDVLTITDVIATNLTNVSNFSLDSATPINVAGGATGTFDVSFDVGVNGAFGFDMDIANNDSDEANYDIAVSGTGTGGTPEIDIQRPAGTSINDGGVDAIGTPGVGVVNLTYTVDNSTGTAQLTVFGVTAANETNVSGFALGTATPINVPAGGTGSFDISFNVDAAGAFSFDMDIVNDDADETNYDIVVSGAAADLVVVLGGNTSPLDGDVFTDGPTALSVQFNKETLAGGAGVPGAADNPANYLLLWKMALRTTVSTRSPARAAWSLMM